MGKLKGNNRPLFTLLYYIKLSNLDIFLQGFIYASQSFLAILIEVQSNSITNGNTFHIFHNIKNLLKRTRP